VTLDPVHDIHPGLPIHTLDGEEIGTVKELTADLLKVDAPLHPDYWLGRADVLSFTNERVTLSFNHAELDEHKRSGD
jgi:hypothetical protein